MKIIKELSKRTYKAGYIVKEVLLDGSDYDSKDIIMKRAYNLKGECIGSSKWAYKLCKIRGIKPQYRTKESTVCSIGFCEKEQKWYGWSHRAICGFGIGSEVKKDSCGYKVSNVDDLYRDCTEPDETGFRWMKPEDVEKVEGGIKRRVTFIDTKTNEESFLYDFIPVGRGEWKAESLEDAKQMAVDFADGVA